MNTVENLLKEHSLDASKLSRLFKNTLYINNKLLKRINKIPAKELKTINESMTIARELIILFLTNFNGAYYRSLNSTDLYVKEGYTQLSSKKMEYYIHKNYSKIIELLIDKGIVIKGRNYITEKRCNEYRLNFTYFNLKFTEYSPKTDLVIKKVKQRNFDLLKKAVYNPIARNHLDNLSTLKLPSRERIEKKLLEAVKKGYINKKGKLLKKLGKKKRLDHYVYVEDYLDIFDYLTKDFLIPVISANAGGRVYTSLNLLPSLIKEELQLVEVDMSCLHPNLANKIYKGSGEIITHEKVAEFLGIERTQAKIEHLSFLNKDFVGMRNSPLFDYYMNEEPAMMDNIIDEKREKGYKQTSLKLFTLETKIMTDVMLQLKKRKIYAVYNFDAFLVNPRDAESAKCIMSSILKKHGINTVAKYDDDRV